MPDLSYWNKHARDNLVGKKIVDARYMTDEERENSGWGYRALVIVFDDGSLIYPSADDEGNDTGALFGQTKNNKEMSFPVV